MRSRIEEVGGVQEPEIAISGSSTVLVQLPGVEDEQRALDAIGQTGQLSFRPVLESTFGEVGPLVTTTTTSTATTTENGTSTTGNGPSTTTTSAPATTTTQSGPTTTTTLPPNVDPVTGLTIEDDPTTDAYLPSIADFFGQPVPEVIHVGPAALLGADVADAIPGFDPSRAQWVVNLDLSSEGADKFADLT